MPVRSKGKLLAGAGAMLALCVTGPGCQSQLIRTATMTAPAPTIVATSATTLTVVAGAPVPASRFSFFRRARPAAELQAPVIQSADRRTDAANGMAVIASSWRSIDRGNGSSGPIVETPVPAATAAAPVATADPVPAAAQPAVPALPVSDYAVQQTGARGGADPQAVDTPWRPAAVAATSTPAPVTDGAVVQSSAPADAAPTPRLVPQPVAATPIPAPAPGPAPARVVAHSHYHYPSGGAHDAPPPPVPAVPREFEKQSLPPYVVEPPDILLINASNAITLPTQQLQGQHLVRPDGTINLGIYGSVFVAGLTLDQIQDVVASVLKARHARKRDDEGKPSGPDLTVEEIKLELQVDVLAYNSKVYYIITDGGGYGEQVYRISATGNETVLDALSQINGLPAVASKKRIWVARATPDHSTPMILPVDWCGIVKNGQAATNYQVFPGDRIYVNSDARIRTDSALGKFLAPVERVLGTVLLGSSTVNSIKNGNNSGSGVP